MHALNHRVIELEQIIYYLPNKIKELEPFLLNLIKDFKKLHVKQNEDDLTEILKAKAHIIIKNQ